MYAVFAVLWLALIVVEFGDGLQRTGAAQREREGEEHYHAVRVCQPACMRKMRVFCVCVVYGKRVSSQTFGFIGGHTDWRQQQQIRNLMERGGHRNCTHGARSRLVTGPGKCCARFDV